MHRTWGKPDANQAEIIDVLRAAGFAVQELSGVGKGCPDLLVADRRNGFMCLMEVKMLRGVLTPKQVDWIETWPAKVHVVHTAEEALAVAAMLF